MRVADAVRTTAFVRRLHVGDVFDDGTGVYEVMRTPEVINGDAVKVYLLPTSGSAVRARAYAYDHDARVNIVR